MKIRIKRLNNNAVIPTKGSEYAAGYDLYAEIPSEVKTVGVHPGETIKFCTGIAMEIPEGFAGMIFARSGSWLLYLSAVCRPRISSGLRAMTSVRL